MASYNKAHQKSQQVETWESESLADSIGKNVKNELGQAREDTFRQLLGDLLDPSGSQSTESGSHKPKNEVKVNADNPQGVIFDLASQILGLDKLAAETKKSVETAHREPGINYHAEIVHSSERSSKRETAEQRKQIEQIKAELRKLVSSTKSLQAEFGIVTVEEAPATPGEYHVSFFEWMFIMIKQARQKVEDSQSWLSTVKGKGKKGYNQRAKDEGTSFTQNSEHAVVRQAG